MRMIAAFPLLLLAACDVDRDSANDSTTVSFNDQRIEDAATDAGNALGDAAATVGNAAQSAGQAIENDIGDIDVDVDVRRDKSGDGGNKQ